MSGDPGGESVHWGMNTVMTHRAFGRRAPESLDAVRREALRLETLLSRFLPASEISRINRSAGIGCEKIGVETYEVLSRAAEFSQCCQGCFDVTVGPLTALWKSAKKNSAPPLPAEITCSLALVSYADLMLDRPAKTAGLKKAGQAIDLGGIGKGYAGDRFLEIFKQYGISSAYTNIGGNVVTLGAKPDGSPWRVGIRHPRQEDGLIGLVSVTDKAVVTSGDYQRYFIGRDGKMYHHILDPSTGYPAHSGLASVSIVADDSISADALSTILFIAGRDRGLEVLKHFPTAEAILVDTDLKIQVTAGLREYFQAADGMRITVLD